ncbi:MAG: restriction endonuclease subunit S [Polyangiales bacterium]
MFIRVGNLDHNTIRLDLNGVQHVRPPEGAEGNRTQLRPNDILISITAELGMVGLVPEDLPEAYINQHVALARPVGDVDARFLAWFFATEGKVQLERLRRGATKAGLGLDDIRSVDVSMPPLNEQRRIVDKIEALTERSRRAKEALDAIPPLLERFRQSVLAAAFRGDLTADWRAKNPDVESADKLLERIRAERRRRWEEDYLAGQRAKGKEPTNDKWKAKYVEPEPVDMEGLPELPAKWCWVTLDAVITGLEAGHSPRAHGRPANPEEYGVLKVSAVTWGTFLPEENKALMVGQTPSAASTVRRGDLLITRANTAELVGAVVYVDQDHPRLMLSDKTLRIVPLDACAAPEYLLYALRSRWVRAVFEEDATGTSNSMRNLSQPKIRSAPIPLPPLAEQRLLVSRLKGASDRRNAVRELVDASVAGCASLEAAILAKAFRGELVAREPSDEPASEMLARLNVAASRRGPRSVP